MIQSVLREIKEIMSDPDIKSGNLSGDKIVEYQVKLGGYIFNLTEEYARANNAYMETEITRIAKEAEIAMQLRTDGADWSPTKIDSERRIREKEGLSEVNNETLKAKAYRENLNRYLEAIILFVNVTLTSARKKAERELTINKY